MTPPGEPMGPSPGAGRGEPAPPVLIVSASDSSASAGMQVDLRVLDRLGCPARCALTALTVQGDEGLVLSRPVPADLFRLSLSHSLATEPAPRAVKVGLITDVGIVMALADSMGGAAPREVPVVVDPVLRSTHGSVLAGEDAAAALVERLLPLAAVVTPNTFELRALAVRAGFDDPGEEEAAGALLEAGAGAVLVTGGDAEGDTCRDTLYTPAGARPYTHPKVSGATPRGTGCALSTALACFLGRCLGLEEAVERAIGFTADLIEKSVMVGRQRLLFPSDL